MLSSLARERQKLLNVRLQMIARCHNPDTPQFADYGGRGITVCDRWRASPSAFIEDVGPRPKGMTLDRIDNDRGYQPDNVQWASRAEQQRNRRGNIRVEWKGQAVLLIDACADAGMSYDVAWCRLNRGWSATEALTVPVTRANRGTPRGRRAA